MMGPPRGLRGPPVAAPREPVIMFETSYQTLLTLWIAAALLLFPVLLRVTVPYGRHAARTWGPVMDNRRGWFLMESVVILVFSWFFLGGGGTRTAVSWVLYGTFMAHYLNRTMVFPLQVRRRRSIPVVVVALGMGFNVVNGYLNGYWLGTLAPAREPAWFHDWRFLAGAALFTAGMALNVASDQRLMALRRSSPEGYSIPRGGPFELVSCPNLLGEMIEWTGWALMGWNLAAFSFALWTVVNLLPRALDHHRWYRRRFPDYPPGRKAVVPFLL